MTLITPIRHFLRRQFYERRLVDSPTDTPVERILKRDGIVKLTGLYGSIFLHLLREEFERAIPESDDIATYGAKQLGSLAWQAITHPSILATVANYWNVKQWQIGIPEFAGKRLHPASPEPRRWDFEWHHDGKHRQIKAMILLTDVELSGQYMEYIPGSHWKDRTVPFTPDEVLIPNGGSLVQCVGRAGTVWLFDTNGIHRGNRSTGATRDTLMPRYIKKSFWRWTTGEWPLKPWITHP